jgi:hopene-associated glycosyltransferase HpnB
MSGITFLSALVLTAWLYLTLFHGKFWLMLEREERNEPRGPENLEGWPRVTAVIPARNEADMIPRALTSLLAQNYPGEFSIVLVDDQSSDGTGAVARKLAESASRKIAVVSGKPLPPGWTGKVWALDQGVRFALSTEPPPDYLLLTDADIAYQQDVLRSLVARALSQRSVLTSVMAKLNCESLAEKTLIPAFIFFFQMLYPFARVNEKAASTAAAAGGCMLVERTALERAGGIGAIRGALIDDCALAKVLKTEGPIWLGLSERVMSLRPYPFFEDIRRMVARSAYAQLRYSPLLLIGTVLGMGLIYIAPLAIALLAGYPANILAAMAYFLMVIAFQPTLRFYHRSPLWGFALPLIATAYVGFTFDSAYQHSMGRGGFWKGRVQAEAGKQ